MKYLICIWLNVPVNNFSIMSGRSIIKYEDAIIVIEIANFANDEISRKIGKITSHNIKINKINE